MVPSAIPPEAGRSRPFSPVRREYPDSDRYRGATSFRPVLGTGHEKAVPTMMIRAVLMLALCGSLALPGARDAAAATAIAQFTLANGMTVVVIPDRRTPVVTHMLWYRVGAADEPPGQPGIAHFLEHPMFTGTAKSPA